MAFILIFLLVACVGKAGSTVEPAPAASPGAAVSETSTPGTSAATASEPAGLTSEPQGPTDPPGPPSERAHRTEGSPPAEASAEWVVAGPGAPDAGGLGSRSGGGTQAGLGDLFAPDGSLASPNETKHPTADGTLSVGRNDAPEGAAVASGTLERVAIEAVVQRNMNPIRYCYDRERTKIPHLKGEVTIEFTIATDGTVSQTATKSTTMGNAAVESCIEGRFMRMQFPQPSGGGIVLASYPFVFPPE